MAVTVTKNTENRLNTARSISAFRGLQIDAGTITITGNYVTGGFAPAFSVKSVVFAAIGPYQGYIYEYDNANSKIIIYQSGTEDTTLNQFGSNSDVAGFSAIPYFVLGHD
jgi:hypothetical protein